MSLNQSLPLDGYHFRSRESAVDDWPAARQDGVRTIPAAIARRAEANPCAPALVGCGARHITFEQLSSSVSSVASDLASAGIQREDRVGLLVPAGIVGAELITALACNVCLVPINPALTPLEIREVVRVSRLKALVLPEWLDTPARPAILEQDVTLLKAALAADGTLGLEPLAATPRITIRPRPARDTDVALLLRSSGTTGAPKLIPVTHGNLVAMAEKLASPRWFNLTAQDRAVCISPLYYAAGLKTVLFVPLMLGASVGFPPEGKAFDVAQWMDDLRPTYLSVSPALLNGIVDRLRASNRGLCGDSLRFIMCAAAYLPEATRVAAQELLQAPVLEYYALSEAGAMAANPLPPATVKPGTVGVPVPGELLIVDGRRAPVAAGAVGHIMVSGPSVMPGYVTTDHSKAGELKDGWLLTGDLGRLDADGYLTLVGRVTEVINRGGEKVFPYEVEKAILQHPAVLEAAAFGVPHPRLGENVAAAAVLKPGSAVSALELTEFVAGRLAAFKLPRRIHIVPSLPRGNTGKILRRVLTEAYAAAPRGEILEPECLVELEIRDIWARLLGTDEIGLEEDFFERGGDSLLATEMLLQVEQLTGQPYPPSELAVLTIRRMAEVLKAALPSEPQLVTYVKPGTGIPLFFCHGDFLTRGIYAQKLAAQLPDGPPVFLLPSFADGSVGSSIEEIARNYAQEVMRVAPGSPIVVGGYCNGGLVAWHLTHLLRSAGVEVAELLLLETMSLNARPDLRGVARFCAAAGAALRGRAGKFMRQSAMGAVWTWRRRVAHFTYSAARRKLWGALQWQVPAELRRNAFETGQVFLGMMSRYVPPAIDVDVTCFIAAEGTHFDTDPRPWRHLARSVAQVSVPGNHTTAVVSERQALAAAIAAAMERVAARRSPGA